MVRRVVVFALVVLSAGLAEARRRSVVSPTGEEQWREAVAARGLDPDQVVYPFASTPEMDAWVRAFSERTGWATPTDRLQKLQQALFDRAEFPFRYEEPVNLTAAEAFTQRRGNCMSFTAMFIALSRRMGVPTVLVSVARDPRVEKRDDLVVVSRHVVAGYNSGVTLYLYDFYLASERPYVNRRVVDDVKASAMFHTNLGGEAIREGNLELARRHLETATRLEPELASAWVNLGVVRSRSGDPVGALAAYEKALRSSPEQSSALTNMAYIHQQAGRVEEARAALRAAAEGRSSPFTLIALADVETSQGNYAAARGHLGRARRAHRGVPEVHEALARLERSAGDPIAAERHRRRADRLRHKEQERRAEDAAAAGASGPAAPPPVPADRRLE